VSETGQVVVLNGAPRSGKSSIAFEIQTTFEGTWMNLGVDVSRAMTPPSVQPGIGLRPGEPSHPAAQVVPTLYAALWESIAAHSRLGLAVVVDVGLYDRGFAADATRRLDGLPVLFAGVHCPKEVVVERRQIDPARYATDAVAALRWERAVHPGWSYDVEVDTSVLGPAECAAVIRGRLEREPPPSAFFELGTFLE